MTATVAKFTVDEYHRMINAGILANRRVELLAGVIVEMAPEGTPHAAYSQEAGDYLRALVGDRAKIREAKPVTLPNDSEPEPDVAVVKPHAFEVYVQRHPYPSDIFWVIEFSDSSLTKDLEDKNKAYAAADITEYWVVNLREVSLTVFREPGSNGYQSEKKMTQGTIIPLAFADIAVSVQRLLKR
jgi:Uma2 family endonuclease